MKLVDRLGIPWPDHDVEEVVLPAWVFDLCDEARTTILELSDALTNLTNAADDMAMSANDGSCDEYIEKAREVLVNLNKN